MRDQLSPDGNSFMAKYGLKNELVCRLIARGNGELVALPPDEIKLEPAPKCPGLLQTQDHKTGEWRYVAGSPDGYHLTTDRAEAQPCHRLMKNRPDGWVCYEHPEPVRAPRKLLAQKLPPAPYSIEGGVDRVVDMEYAYNPASGRHEWVYVTKRFSA